MSPDLSSTAVIARCLERLQAGDKKARDDLLAGAADRLLAITRKVKRSFAKLERWEQTDDVFQNASLRLCRALEQVEVRDVKHFYRLAATQIRRELVDLVRRWHGPEGAGRHHYSEGKLRRDDGQTSGPSPLERSHDTYNPRRLAEWTEIHEHVDRLPDAEREVFDLLYYHGLPQEEAARLLGVDVRTVKRRWRSARLALYASLGGGPALD